MDSYLTSMIVVAMVALALGGLIGWLVGGRGAGALRAQRDALAAERDGLETDRNEQREQFKQAIIDLEAESTAHHAAQLKLAAIEAAQAARDQAHAQQLAQLTAAQDALKAQFAEVGQQLLDKAQADFLARAGDRFKQSEDSAQAQIKALLTPVHERLSQYEATVTKVEAERRSAFGLLQGQIEAMRAGSERVSSEAAKLVNALRNAPKARGRWGEQQLRNVLESCGLSEHADFETEVSVAGDNGRLRPDVIIKVPGGKTLIVDAKVSLNAYQDAFAVVDDRERDLHLAAHAAAMKAHVNTLGAKAYQNQFDTAPDYVIMFVPGEHFLAAALEHDHELWDFAFDRRVLLATPTNLIAIARTIAAVWQQEKVVGQAKDIAALGRELYARMATMGEHITGLGKHLEKAATSYNQFIGSFETKVLTQAKRFEDLGVDTQGKALPDLSPVEIAARPLTKIAGSRANAVDGDATGDTMGDAAGTQSAAGA